MYMKNVFIAEATIQNRNVNERYFLGQYSHLDSSAGIVKKDLIIPMIGSHWALQHIALKYI